MQKSCSTGNVNFLEKQFPPREGRGSAQCGNSTKPLYGQNIKHLALLAIILSSAGHFLPATFVMILGKLKRTADDGLLLLLNAVVAHERKIPKELQLLEGSFQRH